MKHLAALLLLALLTASGLAPAAQAQRANTSLNMPLLGRWQDPNPSVFYNDLWGYAANGREYAIVGSSTGTNFIDVTNPRAPTQVDYVAGRTNLNAIWRDYKTYQHYAYGVADGAGGNSLQIFDLQYLPDSVHLVYDDDTLSVSSHTCFIDADRLYLVNNKRFWATTYADVDILSLANPERPRWLHAIDLPRNVNRTGGHAMSARRDTLFISGGYGGMFVYDARNPLAPRLISRFGNQSGDVYNHTSWTTSNGKLMVVEEEVPTGRPLQLWDLTNIRAPRMLSSFNTVTAKATPHNPFFVQDRYIVASWYQDGVQVWDAHNPRAPTRVGYYDTYPDNDSSNVPGSGVGYDYYHGCWGVYPYLPSGNIISLDITYGLFVNTPPYGVTGVSEPAPTTLAHVWPNPTTGTVRLTLSRPAQRVTVEVLNALGQTVRPAAVYALGGRDQLTVPLADVPAGIYSVRVAADGAAPTVRRVVRQ
ncbi:MAG: choice-of-anchor B family protein [Hymenobacteraceae bacterium]|nr:choice-of-anchor B family protein [Hymenobacteraceae bacterium]